jgi:hypothetical protein
MFDRPLHHRPFVVPRGIKLPDQPVLPFANVSHTPGQAAAIRFFDPGSRTDLQAMREILSGRQVKKWMDDAHQISQSEYREWAGTMGNTSFLFAVLDSRAATPAEMEYVRGFVYLYSEREEKFRVRRMEKFGFIPPAQGPRYALEVSFAVRPLPNGMQSGSGLMSSALRQSCLQAQMLVNSPERPEVVLFGFTDQANIPSQRTLEAAGFVRKGLMRYDSDSEEETLLYILNWRLLQKKVREKLLEALQQVGP